MNRVILGILGAGVGLALSACGAVGLGSNGPSEQGYLWNSSTEADFVTLTTQSSEVSGTLDVTGMTPGATSTSTYHETMSGTVSGTTLSLAWDGTTIRGQYQGTQLILWIPENGIIDAYTFNPATSADYNRQAERIDGVASTNLSRQQEAAAKAAAQAKAAQAREDAQAQAIQQKEDSECSAVGGSGGGDSCIVDYSGGDGETYIYDVTFDSQGNIVPDGSPEDANAAACQAYAQQLGFPTVYHSNTDICS